MTQRTVSIGQLVAYGNSVGVVGTKRNLKGELLVHLFTADGAYDSQYLPAGELTPTPPAMWENILEGEYDNVPAPINYVACTKVRYVK